MHRQAEHTLSHSIGNGEMWAIQRQVTRTNRTTHNHQVNHAEVEIDTIIAYEIINPLLNIHRLDMKSSNLTLHNISHYILSLFMLFLPFTHRNFIEAVSLPILIFLASIIVIGGGIIAYRWYHDYAKGHTHLHQQARWIIPLMLAWLGLMMFSVYLSNDNHLSGVLIIVTTFTAFIAGWLTFDFTTEGNIMLIVHALSIGAIIVIVFALCDTLQIKVITTWLDTFNGDSTFVDVHRVMSVFPHPNIMVVYLELTLPFVIVWLLTAKKRSLRYGLAIVLITGTIMIVLSLSRGGMIAFTIASLLFSIIAYRSNQYKLALTSVAFVICLVVTVSIQLIFIPRLQIRLTNEATNDNWYRAIYIAPEAVQANANEQLSFELEITNTGLIPWEIEGQQPVNLGYHIICPNGLEQSAFQNAIMSDLNYIVHEGERTALPHSVQPNQMVTVNARINAPATAGHYWIAWDLVQESVTWFSNKSMLPAITILDVNGYPNSILDCHSLTVNETSSDQPSRFTIWETGLKTVRDHPITGIGTRNFPTFYQHYTSQNIDIPHAHNLYLALMVDFGAFSIVFMLITIGAIIRLLIISRPRSTDDEHRWALHGAIFIALTAFLLHSAVESFYYQPMILITVAIIIGLLARYATNHDISVRY